MVFSFVENLILGYSQSEFNFQGAGQGTEGGRQIEPMNVVDVVGTGWKSMGEVQ